MIKRIALSVLVFSSTSSVALAHGGHLGELAGHSHWIGAAALAGAALVAGVVAWAAKKDKTKSENEDDVSQEDDVAEGEAVQ